MLYDEVYLLWKLGLPQNVDFFHILAYLWKNVCMNFVLVLHKSYNLFQVVCHVTYLPQNIGPPK